MDLRFPKKIFETAVDPMTTRPRTDGDLRHDHPGGYAWQGRFPAVRNTPSAQTTAILTTTTFFKFFMQSIPVDLTC